MEEDTETGRWSNLSKMTQLEREKARQPGPRGCARSHHTILLELCRLHSTQGEGKAGELLSGKAIFTPPGFWFLKMVLCIALHRLTQGSQEDIMRNSARPVSVFSFHFHQGTKTHSNVTIRARLFLSIHGKWEHEALSVSSVFSDR